MKQNLLLEVGARLSENGFSLDELVIKTKELFETEGLPGFLQFVLLCVESLLCARLRGEWDEEHERIGIKRCCGTSSFERANRTPKTFITSIGVLKLDWVRMRCEHCRASFVPLRHFLGIERYQGKTAELERIVAEVVSEQSYRRTSRHLKLVGEIPVSKSQAHRWVMKSDCDQISPKKKEELQTLIADGTGYKKRPPKSDPTDNGGEIRLVIGITKQGKVAPMGAWSGESWRKIGNEIQKANQPHRLLKPKPIADTLVSDGEEGIATGLSKLARGHQRCHWHLVHDLPASMRYQDGASQEETRKAQSNLAEILEIELPKQDFEQVKEEDRLEIEKSAWMADRKIAEFASSLRVKGYYQAATYIDGAREKLFSYVKSWLRSGLAHPRVSSMIERMMREIGRRLKKIAFGWSEEGAAKMTRIIIKRITSANEWEAYWKERLRVTGAVELTFRGARAAPSTG